MNGIKWGGIELPPNPLQSVIIVASGQSVQDIDIATVRRMQRDGAFVIAVNGAADVYNFADAWFTLDPWGLDGPQLPKNNFKGKLIAAVPGDFGTPTARNIKHRVTPRGKILFLHRLQSHNYTMVSSDTAFRLGLSEDRGCVSTGNSGYGALNVAFHMRPKNVYLLGVDGGSGYFYTNKTTNRPLTYLNTMFTSSVEQLKREQIAVYNVSPKSTVTCFEKITAEEFNKLA